MVNWARLKDGRRVIVTTGKTRRVSGEEYFIDPAYTEVLLDGGYQIVRKDNLKPVGYGGPWEVLNGRS